VAETDHDRVSQVNEEKLDDEEVTIYHAYLACKAIVFQPNVGIHITIILDDDMRCLEVLRKHT
jgi:hypothetical protein